MNVLITGASTGIGRDIARVFSKRKDCKKLILVARNLENLQALAKELQCETKVIAMDLSIPENCKKLVAETDNENIDFLVNNAGFGAFGDFKKVSLEEELNLINLNIIAVHILTKLFLEKFREKNNGRILNVSSLAGFFAGPGFSSYYASKNYVSRLSEGIYQELKRDNSKVTISLLCPGPVETEFGKRAGVQFTMNGDSSYAVAEKAVRDALKGKLFIIPGLLYEFILFLSRLLPRKTCLWITDKLQASKCEITKK